MTAASTAGVKKPARRHSGYPTRLSNWACEARRVEIRVAAVGCICMVRDGGWLTAKGSCTFNTRGSRD